MKTSRFSSNGIVEARSHKRLLSKGKLLVAALSVSLALASHQALAITAAGGAFHLSADEITTTTFDTLASKTFTLPEGIKHECVAVASSEAQNPLGGNVDNRYEFGLGLNGGFAFGSRRTIDMDDTNLANDVNFFEVSSTFTFTINNGGGPHTISWAARKFRDDTANMLVRDSSLSVMCFDSSL